MNERLAAAAEIVGPTLIHPTSEGRVLKLVHGDQTLGRLIYFNSTGQVVSTVPGEGPFYDRLVQEAKNRGLLHGKDIPDHLQHDQEQR